MMNNKIDSSDIILAGIASKRGPLLYFPRKGKRKKRKEKSTKKGGEKNLFVSRRRDEDGPAFGPFSSP